MTVPAIGEWVCVEHGRSCPSEGRHAGADPVPWWDDPDPHWVPGTGNLGADALEVLTGFAWGAVGITMFGAFFVLLPVLEAAPFLILVVPALLVGLLSLELVNRAFGFKPRKKPPRRLLVGPVLTMFAALFGVISFPGLAALTGVTLPALVYLPLVTALVQLLIWLWIPLLVLGLGMWALGLWAHARRELARKRMWGT